PAPIRTLSSWTSCPASPLGDHGMTGGGPLLFRERTLRRAPLETAERRQSFLELRLAPGERGLEALLSSDLVELLADLGGLRIERRQHVEAGVERGAEARRVKSAVNRKLGRR